MQNCLLTCADQVPAQPIPEVVEHAVPVLLHHLGMDVEAGVAQLGDLPSQELNPLGRVTEDDRLIDLKLKLKQKCTIYRLSVLSRLFHALTPIQAHMGRRWTLTLEKRVFRQWTFCRSVT